MKKVENWSYVLSIELHGEVLYLTEKYEFDQDIQEALKAKNLITAKFIKSSIFQKYKYDLEIILLKTTYEWR